MKILKAGSLIPPFLFVLWAATANAGQEVFVEAPERDLETVTVTATRREAREQDVAAAVSQSGLQDVMANAPDVLAATLRGQPGAFFQQTTPGQGIPIVRGLKGSQVLHLVDGMRLNNAFFRDAPNQYFALVDAYAIERVELLRGAAGSLYGADAMGGVVHALTPEVRFSGPEFQAEWRFYGAFTGTDDGWALRADTRMGRGGASFVGGATYQDYGDRETARGQVSPSGFRAKAVDAKALFDVTTHADLMVSVQVLEQPSTPRTDELVPGFGQTEPAAEQFRFEPNERSFLHARYRLESEARWLDDFEVHLARQVITDDRLTQDFGEPLVNTEQNESTLDGLTLQFVSAPAADWHLTWGAEVYRDEVRSARQAMDQGSGQSAEVRARFPDRSRMDSDAAYLSAGWQANQRLGLDVGLRYSIFDIMLPATTDSPEAQLSPDDLTGDLRVLYRLHDGLHLVANLGRGFRPPNVFDLGTLGPRPGNRFNVANPSLRPETVWSYDLGLKARRERWEVEAFAFYLDYQDKITSVVTGDITPEGRVVVRSENLNSVEIYGLEFGLRWFANDRLNGYLNLNYTRGEEKQAVLGTIPADRIPPLNGKAGLEWRPGSRFRIEPFLLFAAEQDRLSPRDVRDPRIDPRGTPAWASLNVNLDWEARAGLILGLKLANLTDKAYREHGSGIDAPGRNLGLWIDARF